MEEFDIVNPDDNQLILVDMVRHSIDRYIDVHKKLPRIVLMSKDAKLMSGIPPFSVLFIDNIPCHVDPQLRGISVYTYSRA